MPFKQFSIFNADQTYSETRGVKRKSNQLSDARLSVPNMDLEMAVEDGENLAKKSKKKTWLELKQDVRLVRRHIHSMSPKIPSYFAFREMYSDSGSNICRVYFLGTVSSCRETTLLYSDIPLDSVNTNQTFLWHSMLESSFHSYQPQGRLTREEQLQFERKRVASMGLSSYDFQPSIGRFVFPAYGSVFYFDDDGPQAPPFFPHEFKSSSDGAKLNPLMCPHYPLLIAYINNSDLWVYLSSSFCNVRLTFTRKGSDLSKNPKSAGIPSYVTQEEFNRHTGYWWRPTDSGANTFSILYEEVDECDVEILRLPCYAEDKELEEYRFPRAGMNNAKSTLKLVQFSVNEYNKIDSITHFALNEPLQSLSSNFEYLVRAGWTSDGRHVWAKVLDRQQCHEQLILVPFQSFVPAAVPCANSILHNHLDFNSPLMQVIYEEKSRIWINVNEILYFFPQENEREIRFLWASEESGFRHLYDVTVNLCFSNDTYSTGSSFMMNGWNIANRIRKKAALTHGNWEVSEQDVWVNEDKNLVFFISLKDTPLERHLYVVDIEKPGEPQRLTALGYSHTVVMDSAHSMFLSIQSNISQTPSAQVYQLQYSQTYPVKVTPHVLGCFLESSNNNPSYPHPELFSHQLQSGHLIYGMIFKPKDICPGEKYPTVLTIYGGPEVQLVTNTFKGMLSLRQYMLSSAGYVVVAIDCRGSRHRGLDFEGHIKGRMGTVEIADHVEVLLWLAESTGIINLQRVAVHGWSYGGYLSLMGLVQRSDVFKVAIAGAPVTSWLMYDTGYTERYMDTPSKNVPGYTTGSVLSYIHQFPDEENRLLIIHGMMDENVHFKHTTELINALVKAGKPYHLIVYPTERHSLRHIDASEHYETSLLSFLQQYL